MQACQRAVSCTLYTECTIDTSICQSVFFFFQAEDGIRDYKVTGVQTCALPISLGCFDRHGFQYVGALDGAHGSQYDDLERSEERRVGKECRSRWSPYH